jgi:hypothetical protein
MHKSSVNNNACSVFWKIRVSWCEDKDHSEGRQGETNIQRVVLHGDNGNAPSTQKTADIKWNQILKFKNMERFSTLLGLPYNLPVGSGDKGYFSLFVDRSFCEVIAKETNKRAVFSHKKAEVPILNWEDTNAEEIEACIVILTVVNQLTLEFSFL